MSHGLSETSSRRESAVPEPAAWQNCRRKALVVGIDLYACRQLHDLGGCRNDAMLLGAVLAEAFNFGVVELLDERATRAAVLAHLTALLASSQKDDEVVFFFSGHGSRILSHQHGAFESLVLHDSFRPDDEGRRAEPNRDLIDRELYGWCLKASEHGARVTLLIDACRSGGILRDLEVRPRGVEPDLRRGVLEDKIAFLETRCVPPVRDVAPTPRRLATSGWLPPSDRYTLLAACQADEYCREMHDPETGQQHGILSLHAARELRGLRRTTSWRELYDAIGRRITAQNPGQHAQLEGAIDRQVFGGAWLRPMPFAPVLAADNKGVELGLGAAHGVVRESVWRIFPPTARRPEGPPLASIRIENVGATRARARFDGGPKALENGDVAEGDFVDCRAFEAVRACGQKLRLLLARPHQELERAIDGSALLERVHEPPAADLVIHQLGPRRVEAPLEPAPNLYPLDAPHWVVVGRDGAQAMPARPVPPASLPALSKERLVERAARDLERLARHRFLSELVHPDPERSLARHVEVRMLRQRTGGPWSPIDSGSPVPLDDRIALRLERKPEAPERVYVAALDLGITGAVSLLYPRRAQRLPWERGRLEIGLRTDDAMHVTLPPGIPFAGEEPFNSALETVLIFLSTRWTDFDGLTQDAVGAERSSSGSPLAAMLGRGLGYALRSSGEDNLLEGPEHWGLVACSFKVVA